MSKIPFLHCYNFFAFEKKISLDLAEASLLKELSTVQGNCLMFKRKTDQGPKINTNSCDCRSLTVMT